MAKPPTTRQTRTKAPAAAAVTAPPAPAAVDPTPPSPTPPVAPAPATIASAETIRMLVGQEGPELSRVPGQVLTIGADLDADEAGRLINALFAERI